MLIGCVCVFTIGAIAGKLTLLIACERYIRVTSVTYQSLNIGDKFDMSEHERKG